VHSLLGNPCIVKLAGKELSLHLKQGQTCELDGRLEPLVRQRAEQAR
jgi:hypothetical protein